MIVMKMTSHRAVDDVFGTISFFDFAFCSFSVAVAIVAVLVELDAGATNKGFGTMRLELDRRDKTQRKNYGMTRILGTYKGFSYSIRVTESSNKTQFQ
jgi:hypothetical protein